jgi:hypothetical protein
MSMAKQAVYDASPDLQAELTGKGLKLMHLWSVGPGYFLMMEGQNVTKLADFPGKRFRAAHTPAGYAIEELGAAPVQCSMDEAKEKFNAHLLEGILCPTDTPKGFGLGEFVSEVTFAPCTYDFLFWKIMCPDTWDDLPAVVQGVFDDVNAVWPEYYGKLRTWGEYEGLMYVKDTWEPEGKYVYYDLPTVDPDEYALWVDRMEPIIGEYWIEGDEGRQAIWDSFVAKDTYYATTAPWSTWWETVGLPAYPTPPSPPTIAP